MELLLRDATRIFPFSEARLVAGSVGLDAVVRSANIQEVPQVDRWLKGGEILFSSGYAFQTPEHGVALLRALKQKGAAALALKPGQYLAVIPKEMIDTANEIDFPLFELPEDLPYMDCIVAIFDRLTEKRLYLLERMERIHEQLIQTMLHRQGLEGLCTILSRINSNPVFILGPHGTLLASAGCEGCSDLIALSEGELHYQDVLHMKRNQCNFVKTSLGELICVPIFVENEFCAVLAVDGRERRLESTDLLLFESASSLISVELLQEKAAYSQDTKVRGQLLDDLLFQRYHDERIIIRRGKYVGFDFTKDACVFVVGIDSFESHLSAPNRISEKRVQRIKYGFHQALYDYLKQYPHPVLLTENGADLIGLVSVSHPEDVSCCETILRSAIEELSRRYRPLRFSAGFGRTKRGVASIRISFQEAKQALHSGRILHKDRPDITVTRFEELGCLCFLSELSESSAMRDFRQEYLGPIRAYDQENHTNLEETLSIYFACGGNLRKTSEALFVHKNSVIYRLEKVESLLGKSLHDEDTRFHLQLSLKLADIV